MPLFFAYYLTPFRNQKEKGWNIMQEISQEISRVSLIPQSLKIRIKCPICKASDIIVVTREDIGLFEEGPVKLAVPANTVCSHTFTIRCLRYQL